MRNAWNKWIGIVLAGLLMLGCTSHIHTWTDATCTEPAVCKACGETKGEPKGHDWLDATCTEPKTCRRCGQTEGEPLGHDYSAATCTEGGICARCGTMTAPLGHELVPATCTEPVICRRCGYTMGEPLGHDAHPTCTQAAPCTRCGELFAPLGHDFCEATCTEPKICRRCGAEEGEPKGHDMHGGVCARCGFETYAPITGKGNRVLSDVRLGDGVYRVRVVNSVKSDLTVWAYDANGGAQLLALVRDRYEGTVLLLGESPYTIEIDAAGDWEIAIERLDRTRETSFSGTGDSVTDYTRLSSGAYTLRHDGSGDFVVWLYTTGGETLLVHTVGAYRGEHTLTVPSGSYAFFAIRATGGWRIERSDRNE